MTAITDSRKRSREEDGSDFMPLSKRITNLHINASSEPMQDDVTDYNMNLSEQHHPQPNLTHQHQILQFQNYNQFGTFNQPIESNQFSEFSNLSHSIDDQERQLQYQQYLSERNNASSSSGNSSTNISSSDNANDMEPFDPYDPELSQKENPFYYDKNKLLYDLYLERVRRQQ
ncbi:hypothetical protein Bhyg_15777 [Pseudolycoriella hygida]|uniref:Uncharacterized protein n=1 Tax=Pseudolycoriella hygida TaxID=35572 RepID=A0A9Q0MK24_9DIPT|nr:hypothetical protein Bhyg_15777 [Pseudolycoriella hygida]